VSIQQPIAMALIQSILLAAGSLGAETPSAVLRDAPLVKFPAETDSNSPAHWDGGTFYLFSPVGKVWKWHAGQWNEKGLGGRLTPIFPAKIDWARADADSLWGPSIHWNTHLQQYVILLNRTKDKPGWPQEGIYISFNPDVSNPSGWTAPKKIHDKGEWYPQVIGLDKSKCESDKLAGRVVRFFMKGQSRWEIVFLKPGEKAGE